MGPNRKFIPKQVMSKKRDGQHDQNMQSVDFGGLKSGEGVFLMLYSMYFIMAGLAD